MNVIPLNVTLINVNLGNVLVPIDLFFQVIVTNGKVSFAILNYATIEWVHRGIAGFVGTNFYFNSFAKNVLVDN